MKINSKKTTLMMFNYTKNYQFSTRLKLENENLETITETKLLGTIITHDLKWEKNTKNSVKKVYSRMKLLRKLIGFGAPHKNLLTVYKKIIISVLEQSSNVWHSGLTLVIWKGCKRLH